MSLTTQHAHPPKTHELTVDELFDVLQSPRRRLAIQCLYDHVDDAADADIDVDDIVDEVAKYDDAKRQTCYISLIQTHLPKFDELGLIDYDDTKKQIRDCNIDTLYWFLQKSLEATQSADAV